MTKKWARRATALTLATLLLLTLFLFSMYHSNNVQREKRNLGQTARLFAYMDSVDEISKAAFKIYPYQVVLLSPEGKLLYRGRSEIPLPHFPELDEKSQTVQEYRLQNATYLVAVVEYDSLGTLYIYTPTRGEYLLGVDPRQIVLLAVVYLLLLPVLYGLYRRLANRLVQPVMDLARHSDALPPSYQEFSPLQQHLRQQEEQLEEQAQQLTSQRDTFSLYLDKMQEGLLLLDTQGSILTINESVKKLFQAPPEEWVGRSYLELTRLSEITQIASTALQGITVSQVVQLDGRSIHLHANPVMEEQQVTAVLLLFLDVTQQVVAEQQRREFTANVSHELKTPLTSISGYAELMKNQMIPPQDVPHVAGRVYAQSQQMIHLVEDILKLAQYDEGHMSLPFEPVELDELLQDVVQELRPLALEKGLQLDLHTLPITFDGAPTLLREVFYNLVLNAITYTAEGSVTVGLSHLQQQVVVTVSDTGIGIAPEDQPHIFQRFYRGDKSHSRQTGGTGLGLSIVKHGVQYHGGTVALESRPHIGTTVTVRFPFFSPLARD